MKRIVMLSIADLDYLTPAINEGNLLAQSGYQVDIFELQNKGELTDQNIVDNFIIHRILLWTRFLPKRFIFWIIKYLEFIFRFLLMEVANNASIYVAHNLDALIPIFFIAKLKKGKVLYRAHELYIETYNLPLKFFWRWLERLLVNRIDATITPNEERAEIYYSEYGARKKPYVVMNCPRYIVPATSNLLRKFLNNLGIDNPYIVLFQGSLSVKNGIEEIINAAQYFKVGISLVLCGPIIPEYLLIIELKIKQLEVKDRVFIHEPVVYNDLPKYTASANIGIVLYRNENRNYYYCASNKLFEYFMVGLPVVTSNFPGLIQLVEKSECGIVVDPSNPKEIADAVNELFDNKEKALRMKNNALRSAHIYNWENEGKKLLSIYDSL